MADKTTTEVADRWIDAWNGDLDVIPGLVAEHFVSHAAPLTGGAAADSVGRDLLSGWISGAQGLFQGLRFIVQVGPLRDGDMIVLRWQADANYTGGFPGGDSPADPRPIRFYGTDTLRIEEGKIAEYWANTDSLWIAQQAGVREVPALTGTTAD